MGSLRSNRCTSGSDYQLLLDVKDMVLGSPNAQLLMIQYSLGATIFLYFLKDLFGAIRSYPVISQIIHKSLPLVVALTLWLIHSAPTSTVHVLYPMWASAFTYNLNSGVIVNDRFMWACCFPIFVSLSLLTCSLWLAAIVAAQNVATPLQISVLVIALAGIVTLAVLDVMETLGAFNRASRSQGLPAFLQPVVQHMTENRNEDEQDPASMNGYDFLVWRDPDLGITITTEDIWRMVGTDFRPNFSCADVDRLKDTCLSYAFFRIILMRFASPPVASNEQMTRRFIREGLLRDPNRVFRVVGVELGFLFHFLHTKYPVYRPFSFRHGVGLVALVVLITVARFGSPMLAPAPDGSSVQCKRKKDDYYQLMMIVYSLIWCKSFVFCSSLNSRMVWRLCLGLSKVGVDDEVARHLEQEDLLLYLYGMVNNNKLWQKKLGQYSFLESYGKPPTLSNRLFSSLATVLGRPPKVGRNGDFAVPLSYGVKEAIVASLIAHVQNEAALPLSRGIRTIADHGALNAREYMENHRDSSDAQVLLAWHIATCFCESQIPPNVDDAGHFRVATQLSNYCAYLLAFSPELLPGDPHSTELFFDNVVEQAVGLGMQGLNLYQSLIIDPENDSFVMEGALLARGLIEEGIRWDFMAEFWAELLLYLAPSDNVAAHGEYLARGGEFITHVWALLTHAGIVAR